MSADCLAYFVAKKGDKNGIFILSMPLCIDALPECYDCYFMLLHYFATTSGYV
jgi:hypothetical protein